MFNWIRGWWVSFQLWRHDRATYRFLVDYRHNPDDFVDAPRPRYVDTRIDPPGYPD